MTSELLFFIVALFKAGKTDDDMISSEYPYPDYVRYEKFMLRLEKGAYIREAYFVVSEPPIRNLRYSVGLWDE